MSKIRLSSWLVLLIASIFMVLANSTGLLASLLDTLDLSTGNGIGFLVTLCLLAVLVVYLLLQLMAVGRLQKPVIALFLLGSAVFGYFANQMGVVFDEDMFLNMAATVADRNAAEAGELLSVPMLGYVLLVGVLPATLLMLVEIRKQTAIREVGSRLLAFVVLTACLATVSLPSYKYVSYFAVEHRDLRFKVIPVYPLLSLVRVVRDQTHEIPAFRAIDSDATQRHAANRRSIGIMVVGETARADHFSLDHYPVVTNPELQRRDDVVFAHGVACGTSTLYSVPCMFSMRDHDHYTPELAESESNVLDILTAAGVHVVWIDNNSTCKHVCDRVDNINLRQSVDESSPYYSDGGYYDDAMLDDLDAYLDAPGPDTLLVLHMLGSHGPAYSRRYPAEFTKFTPVCDKISPKECSDTEVINAYDNTIAYTDRFLNRLIEALQARQRDANVFLFYASDHGESLGENGVYLHGLPRSVAPAAQTEVPFIVWLSESMRSAHHISKAEIRAFAESRPSHDNISHTLLGLFDVEAHSYDPTMDLFAATPRSGSSSAGP